MNDQYWARSHSLIEIAVGSGLPVSNSMRYIWQVAI